MELNQKPRNKSTLSWAIVDKGAKNIISSSGIIIYSHEKE